MLDLGRTEISEWAGQDGTASLRGRSSMFATSGRAQLAYEITGVHDNADLLIHAGVSDRRSW